MTHFELLLYCSLAVLLIGGVTFIYSIIIEKKHNRNGRDN